MLFWGDKICRNVSDTKAKFSIKLDNVLGGFSVPLMAISFGKFKQ